MNTFYIAKLVQNIANTGSVCNGKSWPQRVVNNEAIEVAVLKHVALDYTQSTHCLAQASGISCWSITRILKVHKFYWYKTKLLKKLNEDDSYRRLLQFCEEMSQRCVKDSGLLFNICFSDKCTFYLKDQ